jgi:hypothetical protein
MRILKYPLKVEAGVQTVMMSTTAQIIKVAAQRNVLTMWAIVGNGTEAARSFQVIGTGQDIPPKAKYLGSALMFQDNYVWHIFEIE